MGRLQPTPRKNPPRRPHGGRKLARRDKKRELARWGPIVRMWAKWALVLVAIALSALSQQNGSAWERLLRTLQQVLGRG